MNIKLYNNKDNPKSESKQGFQEFMKGFPYYFPRILLAIFMIINIIVSFSALTQGNFISALIFTLIASAVGTFLKLYR